MNNTSPLQNNLHQELADLLHQYQPSAVTVDLVKHTPILLLVGVSGAGKDTIKHLLLHTGGYHHIVSHTTRAPRENHGVMETDGQEYHFVSLENAAQMVRDQAFVEAKLYSGNVYGTSAAEIQLAHDTHKIAVTDLEVQGVAEYKALASEVQAVFVLPPSFKEWMRRLEGRGEMNAADLNHRMHTAITELNMAIHHDYYRFVINKDSGHSVQMIEGIMAGAPPTDEELAAGKQLARELVAETEQLLGSG